MINSQQVIERAIFEALRLTAVADGYTPNITAFADTSAGYESYITALKTIEGLKGFALEIFGSGAVLSRGQIRTPRIVIDWGGYIPNEIGSSPEIQYEPKTGGGFNEVVYDISSDIGLVNVILVSETSEQERYLQQLLRRTLPSKRYIDFLPDSNYPTGYGQSSFLVVQDSALKTSSSASVIREWVYSYSIPDIWWGMETKIGEASQIISIELNQDIVDHLGISHLF